MNESTRANPDTALNGTAEGFPLKSAFISAPPTLDTGPIRAALQKKGVRCFSADEVDLPGQKLPRILVAAVSRADLMIGVVDDTSASNVVFFEVGFAQALDKPTVVLVVDDAPTTTWLASGVPYIRYRPEVPGTLDFSLDQILKIPAHETRGRPSLAARRTHPIGERGDSLLAQLRAAGEQIRERELTTIITEAIRASGVASVSLKGAGETGSDLAVWAEDLSPWVGNPLPIELSLVLRKGERNAAVGTLLQVMARGGLPWGLLIYHRSEGDPTSAGAVPNILLLSAEQFLERLRTTSFGEVVRGLRNQRVHGGS